MSYMSLELGTSRINRMCYFNISFGLAIETSANNRDEYCVTVNGIVTHNKFHNNSFTVYPTTLLVSQTIQRLMIG
jgi:hypothetical protein